MNALAPKSKTAEKKAQPAAVRYELPEIERTPAQGFPVPVIQRKAGCACGGGCPACQAKKNNLPVSDPGDQAEIEADRIADRVLAGPAGQVSVRSLPSTLSAPSIQRRPGAKTPGTGTGTGLAGVDNALAGSGTPMETSLRRDMESRFGYDFSQVRLHTGGAAERSAQEIDANAYTVGNNIVFGAAQFSAGTREGRHLLAHELTHVIQQSSGSNPTIQRQPRGQQRQSPPAAAPRTASHAPAIVEDNQHVSAGQMRRSEFLAALHDALINAADAEFRQFGRSAAGCPYIIRTLQRYANRPLSALMRVIRAFAHPAANADAREIIRTVAGRTQTVARGIGRRQGARGQAKLKNSSGATPAHDPSVIRSQMGSGRELDGRTRERMENSFGTSFASVRVHDDSNAGKLNAALEARAFTVGNHIAFAAGQYEPGTSTGDFLLAHELAHTIQQGTGHGQTGSGSDESALEDQADRAAAAVGRRAHNASSLLETEKGERIQRLPVVLAGALVVAEATPEIIVVAEVASVTTEVVVVDGALVAAADVAVPAVLEAAAPAAIEIAAPAALEVAAPAVLETTAVSSSAYSTAAAAATIGTAATLTSDSPTEPTEEEPRRRRCRPDPCPTPLPVSWPAELPYPPEFSLIRTPSDVREAEGLGDRGRAQARFAAEIADARRRHIPPPNPCDPMVEHDSSRWNAPYDAHHIHPMYLGGVDVRSNLCSLEAHLHQMGHPRLDYQIEHLSEYRQCGICSASLKNHPAYQEYIIVGTKI